ncbi:MAG: elongation factor P maturation arginine rhamnosyltransferase EarP [Pseudomonadota bacterium]|nr:elongation factor P maturation arginine rhamnosyltransferase EarP [Pseudomonadota bacterium]
MLPEKNSAPSLAIFCKVVDNYGDVGICWRLARQLQREHGVGVTLWIDDLISFQRICPQVASAADVQQVEAVTVRHWRDQDGEFAPAEVADIVIEFFGCDIPPAYIAAMARCEPRPVWLNLEGLSAEEWVEGCHTLPSPHPRLPLTKHFYFPGFTAKTGGLLREAALEQQRRQFQSDRAAMAAFLAQFGVTPAQMASLKVSLFCYPHAPVAAMFDAWQGGAAALTCLVPEGVAAEAVAAFLEGEACAGAARTRGALTLRVLPFVAQPDYDKILWACDVNFVRGEDSFVRAQWAARPFIWHIYPQDENLHHVKLRAFLQRYAPDIASANSVALRWNGAADAEAVVDEGAEWPARWTSFAAALPEMTARAEHWQGQMRAHGDLAGNLLKFAATLRPARDETLVECPVNL